MALVGRVRLNNIPRRLTPWVYGTQERWLRAVQT